MVADSSKNPQAEQFDEKRTQFYATVSVKEKGEILQEMAQIGGLSTQDRRTLDGMIKRHEILVVAGVEHLENPEMTEKIALTTLATIGADFKAALEGLKDVANASSTPIYATRTSSKLERC